MRKDYIAATEPADHETEFVEKYWTKVWEKEGGPQEQVDRIPRKDEYRVMASHMSKLPKGARVLDAGCGLGDWTLHFAREGFSVVGSISVGRPSNSFRHVSQRPRSSAATSATLALKTRVSTPISRGVWLSILKLGRRNVCVKRGAF